VAIFSGFDCYFYFFILLFYFYFFSPSSECCKGRSKPESCPCIQKVGDVALLKILHKRVETRPGLQSIARTAMLGMIMDLMQDLKDVSS
jgi:hypothetical protein